MNKNNPWLKKLKIAGLLLFLGINMNACGLEKTTSWKEEVLLHDGTKIVATRTMTRGGHGIAHQESVTEETLTFTMPVTNQKVVWEDKFSQDIGSANFNLRMLEILDGNAYLVGSPMGCLSYNKWGRPNPPYTIFKYQNGWKQITLAELPAKLTHPNLILSAPYFTVEEILKTDFVTAKQIQEVNSTGILRDYDTTIIHQPSNARDSILGCEEMIHYKCGWISPVGTFGKNFMDKTCK